MTTAYYLFVNGDIQESTREENRESAIRNFIENYSEEEASEYDVVLTLVEEEDGCWIEAIEEMTYEEASEEI